MLPKLSKKEVVKTEKKVKRQLIMSNVQKALGTSHLLKGLKN